jgi:hypothetical protein
LLLLSILELQTIIRLKSFALFQNPYFEDMSILSQLAAEIRVATAAAPLTQAPDDTSSESDWSALIPAPQRWSTGDAANARNSAHDDSHESSPCSPCLSSTPPPFVAPDMLDLPPPTYLTAMPWIEQQQCREQLMRALGLYACWRIRRSISLYSAQSQFNEHLLAGRVTKFELVYAYVGLHREVSCLYTICEFDVVFREAPLRIPRVHFRQDGEEVRLVKGADAWNAMHRHFHFKFMPFLLMATAKTVEQAR